MKINPSLGNHQLGSINNDFDDEVLMTLIQSLEDLEQARQQALQKKRALAEEHKIHISIGMASCSIAAGARDTLHAINRFIESESLPGVSSAQIQVIQTGCVGLCALEPLVQIQVADQTPVTYGKVTPEVAQRILQDHVGKGLVVQQYVVDNI
jgi:NADP-reducing hydrogenase subunit HndB